MKKINIFVMCCVLLIGSLVYAQSIQIYIEDEVVKTDVAPELKRNITYVPISFIAEELGANVKWESPKVTIEKDGIMLVCEIGNIQVIRNNETIQMIAEPYISNNRTMVPLRFVSDQLGCSVDYDSANKVIHISAIGEDGSSKDDIPIIKDEDFVVAPNGLWGVKKEQIYNKEGKEYMIYLIDMRTGNIKEIYSTRAFSRVEWLNDSRVLLSGTKDLLGGKERKHIMIYEPDTGKITNIADVDSFEYIGVKDSIIYFIRTTTDDVDLVGSNCKLYDVKSGITQEITKEQYEEYIGLLN